MMEASRRALRKTSAQNNAAADTRFIHVCGGVC